MYKGEQGLNTPRTASQPASSTPLSLIFMVPRYLRRAAHAREKEKKVFFAREESSLNTPKHGKRRKGSEINLFSCRILVKGRMDFDSLRAEVNH